MGINSNLRGKLFLKDLLNRGRGRDVYREAGSQSVWWGRKQNVFLERNIKIEADCKQGQKDKRRGKTISKHKN